jgi:hypothetical protein
MSNNTVVNDRGQSHPRGVKWQKTGVKMTTSKNTFLSINSLKER